ncbi:MAG TPA: M48 family metalloprotease [Anaerolineae bacterium]|nr:M48 family metalloprotease [Anaerolineae bacterium]HID84049.1 hypothetical protein [Anaerolineales bacterium]HIQ08038.1 hypothetical protein [Anaerolineaceae bacterium]
MRNLDPELQAVIRDLEAALGEETLEKARYQLRMKITQFLVGLLTSLVLALLWLPTGWAVALRDALHANTVWWRTWGFILLVTLINAILQFPLDWFFGFRLENRLGTNRQSFGGWLWDRVKQAALGIPVQSLPFLGLYLIFRRWPDRWFLGLVGIVVVFLGVFYLLQPVFLRMQYKAERLDDPELTERLRWLFAKAGVPFAGLSVIKASEKTSRGNAALVPRGAGTEVVIFDTLIEEVGPEGVEGTIAHELGHKVHRDMLRLMSLMGALLIAAFGVGYFVLQSLGTWDGLQGPIDVATLPLLELTVAWLGAALQVLINAYSRRREIAADRFALEMTQQPDVFERVMVALLRQNKHLPQPPAWIEALLYNHPSPARRVLMARQFGKALSARPA